jgi:hypothetical protein
VLTGTVFNTSNGSAIITVSTNNSILTLVNTSTGSITLPLNNTFGTFTALNANILIERLV